MPPSPISDYLSTLRRDLRAGDTTERSHYPTLKALIESLGAGITAIVEPPRSECGAPDFHIRNRANLIIGHIEAKDVGLSLDDAELSEQIKDRYLRALDNLILTNYLEFRWYVRGERRRVERLGTLEARGAIRASTAARDAVASVLTGFLSQSPQGAEDAKHLAVRLARYAHEIRNVVVEGFARGYVSADLRDLRDAVKKELVPDLTDEQFADMFAQTLAYGFFAAWCHHPLNRAFERLGAAHDIPKTNPFLRRLFEMTTGAQLDEEPFVGYVDDLVQLLHQTTRDEILRDFGRRTGREDPVVHFYETFLKEYDPKLRELRGVYYTPEPVVSYMVRSVDCLLKTRFGLPHGLGDTRQMTYEAEDQEGRKVVRSAPRVLLLDPACGTGTFLYAIVNHIRDQFVHRRQAGAWSSYVREQLLPRLFGFELLMAPYTVAHLKLGMQLAGQDLDQPQGASFAYDFRSEERLEVYLTNALDNRGEQHRPLPGPLRVISEEADAAAAVKRDKPILVVIANPPYSSTSANRGNWIGDLVQEYKRGLRERKTHLENDYVKFLRFAQWRVGKTSCGIVAMITDNSYLDGVTHRRMRQSLMSDFDEIWILNLHGNSRRRERSPDGSADESVFDIREGTAIVLLVALGPDKPKATSVNYADIWGTRDHKYAMLQSQDVSDTRWTRLAPTQPWFWFVPTGTAHAAEYNAWPSLVEAFAVWGSGFNTDRDKLCTDLDAAHLKRRMRRFFAGDYDDGFREAFDVRGSTSYDPEVERRKVSYSPQKVRRCLSRPFDIRYAYYDPHFTSRPVADVHVHMLKTNLGIVAARQTKEDFAALASHLITMHKIVAVYDRSSLFPLYLYPSVGAFVSRADQLLLAFRRLQRTGMQEHQWQSARAALIRLFPDREYPRWPNLNPLLLAELGSKLDIRFTPDGRGDLTNTFGPEDVFNYIYAILYCPTYRTRYADFLKRDFPRIPFTCDPKLFAALAGKGAEVVGLHIMESPLLAGVMPDFPERGTDTVDRVKYDDNNHRVYINKTQYFANVPTNVWGFHVGGYQVCDKWLKDRKGRTLTFDDQQHYQRITVALRETIRLMAEIDALIPGWPLT
jgi:predicted helicase